MFNTTFTATNSITATYKKSTENIFKSANTQKSKKQYKSLTNLLKENPLLGKTQYNELNECSLNIIA